MANSLVMTAPASMSAPLPDTPLLRLVGDKYVVTSDSFGGDDTTTILGRLTDAKLGGAPELWTASAPTGFGIDSARLVNGAGAVDSFLAVKRPEGPIEAAVRVSATSGNLVWLVAARDAIAGPQNQVRIAIDSNGAQIVHQIAGYPSGALGVKHAVPAGTEVSVLLDGRSITMSIDGTVREKQQLPAACPGAYSGLARSSLATFALDNFRLSSIVS